MKKKSKLEPKKKFIAKSLAAGIPQTKVARQLQCNQSTVSRFGSKEEVRTAIEEQIMRLMESVPDCVEGLTKLARKLKDLPLEDHKSIEASLKAVIKILEAGGLLASSTPNTTILNIQKAGNIGYSPIVDEILRKHQDIIEYDEEAE